MNEVNILIVDSLTRNGLAVARGLKQYDCYNVYGLASSNGYLADTINKSMKSNALKEVYFIKDQYLSMSFIEKLIEIIKQLNIDVLIPTGTAASLAVSRAKNKLSKFCKVPIEDYQKMVRFHDKGKTMLMASELDIPHPNTNFPDGLSDIQSCLLNATYPLVIKARKGSGCNGVWYAHNKEELLYLYRKITEMESSGDGFVNDRSGLMLQEYIPGELHDVAAFCIAGEMKAGLTQKRIMTKPLSGGGGIVNITTHNEELLNYARKIIHHTKWNGILEFDFKIDERDGTPKLLEINPKLWGTTWLTICAGLNYPHYLVQWAIGEKSEVPADYKVGLIGRWPLVELDTISEKPLTFSLALKRLREFLKRFNDKNKVSDILLSDIKPTLASILINGLSRIKTS